jgi:spermidine synthase
MDFNWYRKLNEGRCIYRSKQNIEVYENSKFLWIQFNARFIQSMIIKKRPQRPVLPYLHQFLLFTKLSPGNICLLGLGGGCAIHLLRPLLQEHTITAVELHEDMIHIAKKFFNIPQHPNLHIICNSAEQFISNNTEQYQHLLVDLGDLDGFPKLCKTEKFIVDCYHALASHGQLMINLTHFSDVTFFKSIIKEIFNENPLIIEADGNWILSINKNTPREVIIHMLQSNGHIKSLHWHPGHGELLTLNHQWFTKIKQFLFRLKNENRI